MVEQLLSDGWYFGIFSFDETPLRVSTNFPDELKIPFEPRPEKGDFIIEDKNHRSLIHREPGRIISVIGYPKGQLTTHIKKRQWIMIGSALALFLGATAAGWFLIQRSLRPITAISETAEDIADGELTARIDEATQQKDEIGALSKNLNQTFDKLESMFERQKRFTSEASHELRTPIAVILGYCQIALEKDRNPEQVRDAIQACRRAGERMKNLTNDLLELSRIESGEINFELSSCPIKEIAEEALELIEPLATEKNITLHDQVEDATIEANSNRLWQVLVNLLGNAIRHTPEGGSITLKSTIGTSHLEIAVIDTGEGIPAQDLPHVFDRFYRVDSSRNRKTGGSGLGLAISETIIKAHGGAIQVKSEVGAGSTFTISLPIVS